ncbi:MAG: sodium-independent anion transporter, partial [Bacteroidota bacterium]
MYNISYPHIAVLGKVKGETIYRNIDRFEEVEQFNETLIVRFDARLYFANVNYFRDFIGQQIQANPSLQHLVLDAKAINGIDSSAIHALDEMLWTLAKQDINFYLVGVKGPVRDKLKKGHLLEKIGSTHILNNVQEAVDVIEHQVRPDDRMRQYA